MSNDQTPGERISEDILRNPRRWVWCLVLIFVASLGIIPFIKMSEGVESFYDRGHARQRVLDDVEAHFVSDRLLFITYETEDVFSAPALQRIRTLSKGLSAIRLDDFEGNAIADVLSLPTLDDAFGSDLSFRSAPLVPAPVPVSRAALEEIRRRAHKNPIIAENFVSTVSDAAAGIVVRLSRDLSEPQVFAAVRVVRELIQEDAGGPPMIFHMTGQPVVEADTPVMSRNDTLKLSPLMLGIAILIIFATVRRVAGVVLVNVVITLASGAALAMVVLTLSAYNPICAMLLPIITVLCVAVSLHYLVESGRALVDAPDRDVRLETHSALLRPAAMSSLTTAIGFGALAFSEIEAVRDFGRATSAAVLAAGFITTVSIGIAWSRWPPSTFVSTRGFAVSPRLNLFLDRIASWVAANRTSAIIGSIALLGLSGLGLTRLEVGEAGIDYFEASHPAHAGSDVMQAHLGGSNNFIISLQTTQKDHFLDPEVLRKVQKLELFLATEGVDRSTTVSDFVRLMHRAFFNEDDKFDSIPDTADAVAQLVLLNSDDHLWEYIDREFAWSRLYVRTKIHNTHDLRQLYTAIDDYLEREFPQSAGYTAKVTGNSYIFTRNTGYVATTQASSLVISLVVIFIVIVVLFRSLSVGLYSFLPNIFPILATLGVMGWLNIQLSVATAMISTVTLGIAVDDTIHFVQSYRTRLAVHGDIDRAVRETFQIKGPAIIFTSVIFTLGFAVFLVADFVPLQQFGVLAGISMTAAIIGDLVLLPTLLLVTRARLGVPQADEKLTPPIVLPLDDAGPSTLVELLERKASSSPDFPLFDFLEDGERVGASLTISQLAIRARAIATRIKDRRGDRALLLFAPGLEFIEAYYGCLFAGVVPVPTYPPDPGRLAKTLPRLRRIAEDAECTLGLTTSDVRQLVDVLGEQAPDLKAMEWIAVDQIDSSLSDDWRDPGVRAADLAFLQYTSGSTQTPRGVMVSHANLVANLKAISAGFVIGEEDYALTWLPQYHDMGLIGFVIQPLWSNVNVGVMSPLSFLERPMRWLEQAHARRATMIGGPNFAFDLCARKASDEEVARLDLSHVRVAFNGAEPVRAATLDRFISRFAPTGFQKSAFFPCYGLAEATLFVTGVGAQQESTRLTVSTSSLSRDEIKFDADLTGETQSFVSCGPVVQGLELAIVDVAAGNRATAKRVGEIWLRGQSVASGYWRNPEATAAAFNVELEGETGWLRTGDLGFLHDDELFVTGRLKDVIVIRGRNHYPQDLELTVENSHPAIRPGCVAAFSVDVAGEERVVVIAEVDRRYRIDRRIRDGDDDNRIADRRTEDTLPRGGGPFDVDRTASAIRRAIVDGHELSVHAVALVQHGTIPKTSSGKIQRHRCRADWLEDQLDVIGVSVLRGGQEAVEHGETGTLTGTLDRATIEQYLSKEVASLLGLTSAEFDVEQPLYTLGLDSLMAVQLKASLEAATGKVLPLAEYLQGPSISDLASLALSEEGPEESTHLIAAAPGPRGDALVGSLRDLQRDPFGFVLEVRRKYGELSRLRLGPYVAHLISQPDHLTHILKTRSDNYVKGENYRRLSGYLGEGLLIAEGDVWRRQREIAMPSFLGPALDRYVPEVRKIAEETVRRWQADGEIELWAECQRTTLRVINQVLFGYDIADSVDELVESLNICGEYNYDNMNVFFDDPSRALDPAHEARRNAALHKVNEIVAEIIRAGREARDTVGPRENLLGRLLGAELDDKTLRDSIVTYMMAGHDTTASALCSTFFLLAKHETSRAAVVAECSSVDDIDAKSVRELEYTSLCIQEAMRLYPPGWLFTRQAVDDDEIAGFRIPKGSIVLCCPYVTHRDPWLWSEPEAFVPERFRRERRSAAHELSYLPFGAGARACIGTGLAMMEMRVMVAIAARSIVLETDDERLSLEAMVTLKPRSLKMRVRAASKSDEVE